MANLTGYTLNNPPTNGDYAITMTFDDRTTSTQTIHFGDLTDQVGGPTAKQQLDDLVAVYAVAYQEGLATAAATAPRVAPSISAIVNVTQAAS